MGNLLETLGYGWVLVGVYAFFTSGVTLNDPTQFGIQVVIIALIYFLPGLIVGGIGTLIEKKK